MDWKAINFEGIVVLDNPLIDLLTNYLDEKETRLSHVIVEAMPQPPTESKPTLTLDPKVAMRLSEAVEIFSKYNYQATESQHLSRESCQQSIKRINKTLWEYLETLEGTVTELFQQLEQVGLEQWHVRLAHVVGSIRDILIHKMEELIWAMRRLEELLWRCWYACESPDSTALYWIKCTRLWSSLIDRKLFTRVQQNQELLNTQYQKFMNRYRGYLQLQNQVDKQVDKIVGYATLASLDLDHQTQFIKLYQLLKLWELNRSSKVLPSQELVLALRNIMSVDKAIGVLRDYYNALRRKLFEKSLQFKQKGAELSEEPVLKESMHAVLKGYQAETHLLGATISHYREFLLLADPDPYVRTRLGYSDWLVGPEPIQTKPLLNLGYDAETLDEMFKQMEQSLDKGFDKQQAAHKQLNEDIQGYFYEMNNPLASQRLMRSHAENLLDKMKQIDELGSLDMKAIDYMNEVLAKLLRIDWKYHVSFGFPLFHQLFATHQGLLQTISDRHHASRMQKFKKLTQQILEWVRSQKTQAHAHEIELDMNDIKGYLQDFLGYVQRSFNEPNLIKSRAMQLHREMMQELLEYRYLFGNFFYRLRQNESEGQLIRRQFLFVDQYFESIEQRLHDVAEITWPETIEESES